ncbi:hypothetical protein [Longimicrobium sp.]|uniref:hypothetical protein n=1 Tax=Longimicrobium sp. TaxID=2029185 RepID=UPI003B3B7C33
MQKLKLKVEELDVESFRTGEQASAEGTINAHQQQEEEYGPSEVSGCTCTTGGTAHFTNGCAEETWAKFC